MKEVWKDLFGMGLYFTSLKYTENLANADST